MGVEVVTKQDLEDFRISLLQDLKTILYKEQKDSKKWLRSHEVRSLLNISNGTLQNLSNKGIIVPQRIGGLNYYNRDDIEKMLDRT